MMSNSCSRSHAECSQWLQQIGQVHLERMTPEMREALDSRIERRRATESLRRTNASMSSHSMRSQRLLSEGLHQMSVTDSAVERSASQIRWSNALSSSAAWAQGLIASSENVIARGEVATVWRDEDAMVAGDGEAAELIGSSSDVLISGSADACGTDLEQLLSQLRKEPVELEDIVAKFAMYEAYGQEVERMRAQVFTFCDANAAVLPTVVIHGMRKQLKKIDGRAAMSIPENTRDWFVYHMMKQAVQNNEAMSAVLNGFGKQLEMLAQSQQSECPICLEGFGSTRRPETLGCCHCVCSECWEHWASVMHGRPFCPLCRHTAFVDVIASGNEMDVSEFVPMLSRSRPYLDGIPPSDSVAHRVVFGGHVLTLIDATWRRLTSSCF